MDEIIKEWLRDLYDVAIEEAKGTIDNERGWQNGSDTDEDIMMHDENIQRNEEYIEILEQLKADVDRM
jgi:RecA/RadA recombinase